MKINSIKPILCGIVATVLSMSCPQAMEEAPSSLIIGNGLFSYEDTEAYLTHIGLEQFPVEFFSLGRLKRLDLMCNDIKIVPAEIGGLTALTSLSILNNELAIVPAEIGKLENLEVLDLSDNKLTTLPFECHRLTRLSSLDLTRNPLMGDEAKFAKCLENDDLRVFLSFHKAREDAYYSAIYEKVFMLSYGDWSVENVLLPMDISKYISGTLVGLYATERKVILF